jgi:hypothetical protein
MFLHSNFCLKKYLSIIGKKKNNIMAHDNSSSAAALSETEF